MSSPAALDERQLADAFEAGRMPDGDFTHRDHVRVAWELLRRHPLGTALERVVRGIRVLARQRGADGLFHATITTFYLLVIADRMGGERESGDFVAFADANPDLVGPSGTFLQGYYSIETLQGDRSRRSFVLPERLPGVPGPVCPAHRIAAARP